jgi:SAM-dependent methyltransferase
VCSVIPSLHPGGLALTERLIQLSGITGGALVADAGCGDGTVCRYLAEKGFYPIGIDIHSDLEKSGEINFIRGDFEQLSFRKGVFDAVLSECVLSIQDTPAAGLKEINRVLKPGGLLLLSDLYNLSGEENTNGFFSKKRLMDEIRLAGFRIRQWEDHTKELRNLIFKTLWEQGSLKSICLPERLRGSKNPGYFLLIAEC